MNYYTDCYWFDDIYARSANTRLEIHVLFS